MGRKRSIHTDITSDGKMEILAEEHGPLHCLVYTWAIPHAEDDGRLEADPRRFRNTVLAALKTVVSLEQVRQIIADIATVADESGHALWTLEKGADGRTFICFPREAWFRHQSYIPKAKRGDDTATATADAPPPDETDAPSGNGENRNTSDKTPKIGDTAEDCREMAVQPQNPSSPSLSLSPSGENPPLSPPEGAEENHEGSPPPEEDEDDTGDEDEGEGGEVLPRRRKKPGRPVPEPFDVTEGMEAWAAEHAPLVNIATETERFVDYWRSEGKLKSDWVATWRNWLRKAQDTAAARAVRFGNGHGGNGSLPFSSSMATATNTTRPAGELYREWTGDDD
jgi:hypothetical protein